MHSAFGIMDSLRRRKPVHKPCVVDCWLVLCAGLRAAGRHGGASRSAPAGAFMTTTLQELSNAPNSRAIVGHSMHLILEAPR